MKIAINEAYGDADKIKIVKRETPVLSGNEVLVKVQSAGLNPKDVLIRKGKFKRLTGSKFPQSIGFECSGIIEASSSGKYKKGDSVFGMINGWKGKCCAEYVNMKEEEIFHMPANISFEQAAGIPLAGQTALQAIRNLGKLTKGNQILINGASGGVGTLAIQIAKALGGKVTSISSTKNLKFCQSLGADSVISYEEKNILELEEKYDVVFDVFGNYHFSQLASVLTKHGRYITTVPKPPIFKEQIFNLFRNKKAKLVYVKSNSSDLKWISEKISEGKIKPVLDKVFNFEQIKTAQKYIETKRAKGKVILQIDGSHYKI